MHAIWVVLQMCQVFGHSIHPLMTTLPLCPRCGWSDFKRLIRETFIHFPILYYTREGDGIQKPLCNELTYFSYVAAIEAMMWMTERRQNMEEWNKLPIWGQNQGTGNAEAQLKSLETWLIWPVNILSPGKHTGQYRFLKYLRKWINP